MITLSFLLNGILLLFEMVQNIKEATRINEFDFVV